MTDTQELLTEPVSGEDLAAEIERAGKPVGKLTLLLIAVLLVAVGFAGGVWAGRSSSTGSGPASVQPSQNGGRTGQQGGYGGLPSGGQGGFPGGGQGGGFPAG
ncbi:hypothetical protein [Amycolatopsis acidicola]|uniref:hypothetical protein n=1 Tax=Amycolatopsis acidicola TaxID=2596893 RepID=UPI001AA06995|nr:hypothetical protein [Amycolatopsis acidicola]